MSKEAENLHKTLTSLRARAESAEARVRELEVKLTERTSQLERILDSSKEGSWMAKALDAERELETCREQLNEIEYDMAVLSARAQLGRNGCVRD